MKDKASTHDELVQRIKFFFPKIRETGIQLNVTFDDEKKNWIIEFVKDNRKRSIRMEIDDSNECTIDNRCIGFAEKIYELRAAISDF